MRQGKSAGRLISACLWYVFLALSVVASSACCLSSSQEFEQQYPFWASQFICSQLMDDTSNHSDLNTCEVVSSDQVPWVFMSCRLGEAENPGPLRIGTFNPHQFFNKEEIVVEWGPGVWAASETSNTIDAMRITAGRLKKKGLYSAWSQPVQKHTNNAGMMRGRASGTSVISHLRLKPYPALLSDLAVQSSRVTECLVDIGNGTNMFVASMYGPTHTSIFFDPWSLLASLCTEVFDHAMSYKGPAVVMGDFNVDIDQIPRWNVMKQQGWIDAAAFDAARRHAAPSATSKESARRSFILLNPQLARSLLWCDTIEEFEFDFHPLLVADLNTEVVVQPMPKWWLLSTTDPFMFDSEIMNECALQQTEVLRDRFQRALDNADGEEALRQVNMAFENCLVDVCVDSSGQKAFLPKKCLGRCSNKVRPSAPIIKNGKQGDFNPSICQTNMIVRDMTKQVRRLNSLESQLHAGLKRGDARPSMQCTDLWKAILLARGFHPTFQQFVLSCFGVFVPVNCPGLEYVHYLANLTKHHVQEVVAESNKNQRFARECKIQRNIQGGDRRLTRVFVTKLLPHFKPSFRK